MITFLLSYDSKACKSLAVLLGLVERKPQTLYTMVTKFITVLDTDLDKSFWNAVQTADSLANLKKKQTYMNDVNFQFPKSSGDKRMGAIQMREISTGHPASAQIIQLDSGMADTLKSVFSLRTSNKKKK